MNGFIPDLRCYAVGSLLGVVRRLYLLLNSAAPGVEKRIHVNAVFKQPRILGHTNDEAEFDGTFSRQTR